MTDVCKIMIDIPIGTTTNDTTNPANAAASIKTTSDGDVTSSTNSCPCIISNANAFEANANDLMTACPIIVVSTPE